ncbi:MAG: site-2 protease family protein [Asgard group archaeon]|nr:site-2 protease family protein [Asgard group archaeon]
MSLDDTDKAPEEEHTGVKKEVQFCWNCGSTISSEHKDICDVCKAPLDEDIRSKIFSRTEPVTAAKCWRCGGTTSGDVCGICGAPLTKNGLAVLEKEKVEEKPQVSQLISIFSPKDREFRLVETTYDDLITTVDKYVNIVDAQNSPTTGPLIYVNKPENVNEVFEKLRNDPIFTEKYIKIIIRNEKISPEVTEVALRFYYWKPETAKERWAFKNIIWNILLYIATFVTVGFAGSAFTKSLFTEYNFEGHLALDVFLFTFSLMMILTIHELGHFFISRLKKIDVSLPYFIPIPPITGFQTLGTFGALIRQKEPVATRDDLFDIGLAGPVAGFIAAIPLFIIGLRLSYIVDIPPPTDPVNPADVPVVLLADWLVLFGQYTKILPYFDPTIQTVALHPMLYAGYIGFILTGINLMPASQLDGGHTARAVFGPLAHRIVSLVSALLLIVNPFTRFFGLFVLLMSFTQHPGAIDDVSKVHWSKYLYIALGFGVAIICLPLPSLAWFQNLFTTV